MRILSEHIALLLTFLSGAQCSILYVPPDENSTVFSNHRYGALISDSGIPSAPTPQEAPPDGRSINVQNIMFSGESPVNLTLDERIELEKTTWHWYPYRRINYVVLEDGHKIELFCEEGSAIDELPDDVFTQEQRLQGAIILHFIGAIYFFTLLAMTVGGYFLPSVECICEDLNLTQDVAAATFMAIAGTVPEFFTNTISTFIADSDMGIGTVMGSLLFNTLGVAAMAGLATRKPVQLDWWPLTRDSFVFAFHIGVLVGFSWDGRIYWYEAMIFVILLVFYFLVMFQNKPIMKFVKKYVEVKWNLCGRVIKEIEADERAAAAAAVIAGTTQPNVQKPGYPRMSTASILSDQMAERPLKVGELHIPSRHVLPDTEEHPPMTLWKISRETKLRTVWWFYSWPIRFFLTFTIPNPTFPNMRRWYPLTFIMCIIFIAFISFLTFWMMSIIGYTFGIPDGVMGLTFLAMGGCMPEAISAVLIIRTGNGAMGVSNALGANSLAILFSLGMPWFIRAVADGGSTNNSYVVIAAHGLQYTVISLLFAVASLYLVIYIGKYKLRKRIGVALIGCYLIIVTFMLLNELDIFFAAENGC